MREIVAAGDEKTLKRPLRGLALDGWTARCLQSFSPVVEHTLYFRLIHSCGCFNQARDRDRTIPTGHPCLTARPMPTDPIELSISWQRIGMFLLPIPLPTPRLST